MVSRPSTLRHRTALWFRPGLRANADVGYRRAEHSRRDSLRAHARECRILIGDLCFDRRSWLQNDQRRRFYGDFDFAGEGTDRWAVEHNWVSVTQLRLDLTDEKELGRA